MVQKKLPLINSAHGSETRNIINELIKLFNGMGYTYDEALQKAHDVLNEARKTNNMNKDVQNQLDKLIIESGNANAEVSQARNGEPLLKDRLNKVDEKLNDISINAKLFGLSENATWQTNRDALQQANDIAYSRGGGVVLVPDGVFSVKGVMQDSHVTFLGSNSVLKHPDGINTSIITARKFYTHGNINAGSNTLTVDDAINIERHSMLAIHCAGGILDTQYTALSNNISDTTTSITIDVNDGNFPTSGHLVVGQEIIEYSSISGRTLNGVKRGALGTTSRSHTAGVLIGVCRVLYAEVNNVEGNTITLNTPALQSVRNAEIVIGSIGSGIVGIKTSGNRLSSDVAAGNNSNIMWELMRFGYMENIDAVDSDFSGVMVARGSRDCVFNNVRFDDIGIYDLTSGNKGGALWFYQGANRNKVTNLKVTGPGWLGVYIDDRTTRASIWDAPCEDNSISHFDVDITTEAPGYPPGIVIVGSNRNKITHGKISGTFVGIKIEKGGQWLMADDYRPTAKDNEIFDVHLDVKQPWNISSEGNRIHSVTYTDKLTTQPVTADGNLVYAVSDKAGDSAGFNNPIFGGGNAYRPSIGFIDDADTGFFRYGENTIAITLGGVRKYTLYPTELRLEDGVNVGIGNDLGTKIGLLPSQKLAFYGRTPVAQQETIQQISGRELHQIEADLNRVINVLKNLGLIAL